jgi:uncharacterized protein
MELTLERPGDHLFVRSVSEAGIQVIDRLYSGPLILSTDRLLENWDVASPGEISEIHLQPIFDLGPEVVLVGTGAAQIFLSPEIMMAFYRKDIGVEVMTTDAACRTFNVLASEGRNVVAAMLPPDFSP